MKRALHRSVLLVIFGCGAAPSSPPSPSPAPELGTGDHSQGSIVLTVIADKDSGLTTPRDLAFNPLRPDELWVVNQGDDSTVIVHDASSGSPTAERRKDGYALHFMAKPSSIAFGADFTTIGKPGTFATCEESRNTYDDTKAPNDFMGATLWSSDLTVFAMFDPNGLGSHLDMLHESPGCVGIAHEKDNVYWAFGGYKNEIVRYDFARDNGIGNDDHSDGRALHYVRGLVKAVVGIPGHTFFRPEDGKLYIADTGNGRVVALDTTSGTIGAKVTPKEPMAEDAMVNDAMLMEVVPNDGTLQAPSGLEIHKDVLYVSDNATSRITAFALDTGKVLNYVDTGLPAGSLMGMAFGPDGKLYLVDAKSDRVLRIDPKPRQ